MGRRQQLLLFFPTVGLELEAFAIEFRAACRCSIARLGQRLTLAFEGADAVFAGRRRARAEGVFLLSGVEAAALFVECRRIFLDLCRARLQPLAAHGKVGLKTFQLRVRVFEFAGNLLGAARDGGELFTQADEFGIEFAASRRLVRDGCLVPGDGLADLALCASASWMRSSRSARAASRSASCTSQADSWPLSASIRAWCS